MSRITDQLSKLFHQKKTEQRPKTTVINLFGAPGSGKSTLAAEIYSILKTQGKNCELVREYVKLWAWENKQITPLDQIYLLGQQVHAESMLYGKVEYIITDSPILLVGAYQRLFFSGDYIQRAAIEVVNEAKTNYFVSYSNYLLPIRSDVKPEGRFHSQEQIEKIGRYLPNYLLECNETFKEVKTSNEILGELFNV